VTKIVHVMMECHSAYHVIDFIYSLRHVTPYIYCM